MRWGLQQTREHAEEQERTKSHAEKMISTPGEGLLALKSCSAGMRHSCSDCPDSAIGYLPKIVHSSQGRPREDTAPPSRPLLMQGSRLSKPFCGIHN